MNHGMESPQAHPDMELIERQTMKSRNPALAYKPIPKLPVNLQKLKKKVVATMARLDRKHVSLAHWKSTTKRTSNYVLLRGGKEYPATGVLGPNDIHGYLRHRALQVFRFESTKPSDWSELELTLLFAFLHVHGRTYAHTDIWVQYLCDALNSGAVRKQLQTTGLPLPVSRTPDVEPRTPFSVAPKLVQLQNLRHGQEIGFLPADKSPERELWSKVRRDLAICLAKALEVLAPEHTVAFQSHAEQAPQEQERRLRKPVDGTLRTEAGKTGVGPFQPLPFQPKSAATVSRSSAGPGINGVVRRTHEAIVNALARAVKLTGCELLYNPMREDLIAIWPDRVVLFEVKIDTQATDVEQGLGQLIIYGLDVAKAYPRHTFQRVLVVPCRLAGSSSRAYQAERVYIMTFEQISDSEFTFADDPDMASPIFTRQGGRSRRSSKE
jgi:hypothetical protein